MTKKKKIWLYVTLGTVGFLTFGTLYYQLGPATIYFDNGHEESFDIFIDGEKRGEVSPLDFTIVKKVKNGDHEIEIKKGDEVFDSYDVNTKGESYIYNIGGKYSYYIVVHEYTQSGTGISRGSDERIGYKKFFKMPHTDYGLGEEAPDEVEVGATTGHASKSSLQRVIE